MATQPVGHDALVSAYLFTGAPAQWLRPAEAARTPCREHRARAASRADRSLLSSPRPIDCRAEVVLHESRPYDAQSRGGRLRLDSQLGAGTTVRIDLPAMP